MKTKLELKPHAEAAISGTLSVEDIDRHFGKALDAYVREIELPGFRKGKAPKERVLQEVGEKSVWRAAAEAALKDEIGGILKEHALQPLLPPTISLSVGEAQKEVPFTITIVTAPKVEITDYKATGEKALKNLQKLDEAKERGEARKSLDAQTRAMLQVTEERALTDDESKKLGFESAAALQHFLDEEAVRAVENFENQRKRGAVAEALIAAATIDAPSIMVAEEARAMLESAKQEIARSGIPFNEYLQKRGMNETDMMTEIRPQAEKRLKLDLIFAHIAHKEELKPVEEDVHRVAHAIMHQGVPADRAHDYGAEVSIREQVWALYGLATPKPKETPKPDEPKN